MPQPAVRRIRLHRDRGPRLQGCVLALGAFDGVHQGHQALIRKAVAEARAARLPAVVWTFDPPPKVFFGRAELLTPLAEKLRRLACLEPDHIVVAAFDEAYRLRSAEAFLEDLERIRPRKIWTGEDFRFGAGQAGDVALLGRRFALGLHAPVRCAGGEIVSSSRIRALRAQGLVEAAEALLGWLDSGRPASLSENPL